MANSNLYTQQAFFNGSLKKQDIGFRESYFTFTNYFLVGVNSWLNIGAEVWINSVERQLNPVQTRAALGYVAP